MIDPQEPDTKRQLLVSMVGKERRRVGGFLVRELRDGGDGGYMGRAVEIRGSGLIHPCSNMLDGV